VQRWIKRTDAKYAVCGKPIVGRQRGSGDRSAYCSNACRQWMYRRRKQTGAEPQTSTSGIPFMITVDMKRRLRELAGFSRWARKRICGGDGFTRDFFLDPAHTNPRE